MTPRRDSGMAPCVATMSARRSIAIALSACLATGCATPVRQDANGTAYAAKGAVSAEIVDAAAERRYQAVPGSSYLRPVPRRANAVPVYPPDLLDRRLLPVEVVARIVVDGKGAVERASIVGDVDSERAFAEAALAAVNGWTFVPLLRVTGDQAEPLPFTQDYRFTFRQVDGRALVESSGN